MTFLLDFCIRGMQNIEYQNPQECVPNECINNEPITLKNRNELYSLYLLWFILSHTGYKKMLNFYSLDKSSPLTLLFFSFKHDNYLSSIKSLADLECTARYHDVKKSRTRVCHLF